MSLREEAITFACAGDSLVGVLATPEPASQADVAVLIVVGGPQVRAGSHRQFTLLARHLAAAGYAALRFDVRGMGDSTGDLKSFEHITPDIGAAIDAQEVKSLVSPESEKLALRAMISASKADGQIDKDEMQKIVGKIAPDSITEDEKRFVMDEMKAPIDIPGLAAQPRNPAQAAGVYAASLLAIHVDTAEEKRYLADLAHALRLDSATIAELHRMTGAPVV